MKNRINIFCKLNGFIFGSGNGTTFDLIANDLSDNSNGKLVVMKGLKVTSNEDSNPTPDLPTFVTESYRVVVESMRRDADIEVRRTFLGKGQVFFRHQKIISNLVSRFNVTNVNIFFLQSSSLSHCC